MEKEISIRIIDIELKEFSFKTKSRRQKLDSSINITYEIKDNIVEFVCNFELKINKLFMKGIYEYVIELENAENENIEEFIETGINEIIYPLRNKISGLVAKITDEINPFPFILSVDLWLAVKEEEVVRIEKEK